MRFSAALCCLMIVSASPTAADTLFRCEENGVSVFSDRPCTGKQLGSEEMAAPRTNHNPVPGRVKGRPGVARDMKVLQTACDGGDLEACRQLGVSGPGVNWRVLYQTTRTLAQGQLSGKYARYPKETEFSVECLPSRMIRSVYERQDLGAYFLRDGDMISNLPEYGNRSARLYGSRFSTLDEAVRAVCAGLK